MLTICEGYKRGNCPALHCREDESRWMWRKIFVKDWGRCELGGILFTLTLN